MAIRVKWQIEVDGILYPDEAGYDWAGESFIGMPEVIENIPQIKNIIGAETRFNPDESADLIIFNKVNRYVKVRLIPNVGGLSEFAVQQPMGNPTAAMDYDTNIITFCLAPTGSTISCAGATNSAVFAFVADTNPDYETAVTGWSIDVDGVVKTYLFSLMNGPLVCQDMAENFPHFEFANFPTNPNGLVRIINHGPNHSHVKMRMEPPTQDKLYVGFIDNPTATETDDGWEAVCLAPADDTPIECTPSTLTVFSIYDILLPEDTYHIDFRQNGVSESLSFGVANNTPFSTLIRTILTYLKDNYALPVVFESGGMGAFQYYQSNGHHFLDGAAGDGSNASDFNLEWKGALNPLVRDAFGDAINLMSCGLVNFANVGNPPNSFSAQVSKINLARFDATDDQATAQFIYPSDGLSNNGSIPIFVFFENAEVGDIVKLASDDNGLYPLSPFYEFPTREIALTNNDIQNGWLIHYFQPHQYSMSNLMPVANLEQRQWTIESSLYRPSSDQTSETLVRKVNGITPLRLGGETSAGEINLDIQVVGNNPVSFPTYRIKNNGALFGFNVDSPSDWDDPNLNNHLPERAYTWNKTKAYFEYAITAVPSNVMTGKLFNIANIPYPYLGVGERDIGNGINYVGETFSGGWPYGAYVSFNGYIYFNDAESFNFANRNLEVGDVIGVLIEPEQDRTSFYLNGQFVLSVPSNRRLSYIQNLSEDDRTFTTPSLITVNDGSIVDLRLFPLDWTYPQGRYPIV